MTELSSSNSNNEHEQDIQKPREHRPRSYKSGIITYQNQTLTIDCVVRNLTEDGARLVIETDTVVPNRFHLCIPIDGTKVECSVRWRKDFSLGVIFCGPIEKDQRTARVQVMDAALVVPRSTSILLK